MQIPDRANLEISRVSSSSECYDINVLYVGNFPCQCHFFHMILTLTHTPPETYLSTTSNIFTKFDLMKFKLCRDTTSRYYYYRLPFFVSMKKNEEKQFEKQPLPLFCHAVLSLNSSHFGRDKVTGRKVGRGRSLYLGSTSQLSFLSV